jgi:MTH538 TIR-like domain (DUF1863)
VDLEIQQPRRFSDTAAYRGESSLLIRESAKLTKLVRGKFIDLEETRPPEGPYFRCCDAPEYVLVISLDMIPGREQPPARSAERGREYVVFISYRHHDNKEPGREWASWLHRALETYEVPSDLVGTPNLRGEPIPASLYPVFRDEEELPADADLTATIRAALRNSRLMVVLCSPRAAKSRFVREEIRFF